MRINRFIAGHVPNSIIIYKLYNRSKVAHDQISYRDVLPQTNPSLEIMDQKGMSGLPFQVECMNSVILTYRWKRSEDLEKTEQKKEALRFLISKT